MSTEPEPDPPPDQADEADDADPMRALLKRSLASPGKDAPPRDGELLRGVQRRIRQRSRGKFYGDGWSTSSSRINYALVAGIMLVLVAIAYFALGPMGVSR
jgi:hypothetical protein